VTIIKSKAYNEQATNLQHLDITACCSRNSRAVPKFEVR